MSDVKTFVLEVVSPERLLFAEPAAMATIPGSEGEFGVLARHIPMVASLKPGIVRIYSDKGTTLIRRVFIAGGFCEVTKERVALLVEEATNVEDLNADKIEAEIKSLEYDLAQKSLSPGEKSRLELRLTIAQAKRRATAH